MGLTLTVNRNELELLRNGNDPKLSSILWNGILDQSVTEASHWAWGRPFFVQLPHCFSLQERPGSLKCWGIQLNLLQSWAGLLINLPHSLQLLVSEQSPGFYVFLAQGKRDLVYVVLKHLLLTALKNRKESRKNSWWFGREPPSSERGVSSEPVSAS